MRAALVGASDFNRGHFAGERFDFVVAVDGGYAYLLDAGVTADAVVGDFDSLGYVPEAKGIHRYPPEKDESDLELACRVACEAGCDSLVLYGCLGQRFDHTLAVMQVMVGLARRGICVRAVGDEFALAVLCGDAGQGCVRFAPTQLGDFGQGMYRNYISVFAYGGVASGVCERGLKYVLDDATVPDDVSLGLSNEFTGTAAEVSVRTGCLMVTFPLAAWEYMEG